MTGAPPLDKGAFQDSVACWFPRTAVSRRGVPGGLRGVVDITIDQAPWPSAFFAATLNRYEVPLVRYLATYVTFVFLPSLSVVHVMPFMRYPEVKEAGRKLVDQSIQKLIKAGFTAEPVCQLGNPAEEIMEVASKHHADLIVMGAKGLDAVSRFLLGSVSTRVVQHANCSVLVVR